MGSTQLKIPASKRITLRPATRQRSKDVLLSNFGDVVVLNKPQPDATPELSALQRKNLSNVRSIAIEIWGNSEDADRWLSNPHPELKGATPLSLLKTMQGAHKVEVLLSALDNGFPV